MNISLRDVVLSDIDKIQKWYHDINGKKYLSRHLPNLYQKNNMIKSNDLFWYIIIQNKNEIGTIWLERIDDIQNTFKLGIFLNNKHLFGKGIGTCAINQAISILTTNSDRNKIILDVRKSNVRAIKCYEHIGFIITEEKTKKIKNGNILFHQMEMTI